MYANRIIHRGDFAILIFMKKLRLRLGLLKGIVVEVRGLFVSGLASTRLRYPLFNIKVLATNTPSLFGLVQGGDFDVRQLSPSIRTESSLTSRFVRSPLPLLVSHYGRSRDLGGLIGQLALEMAADVVRPARLDEAVRSILLLHYFPLRGHNGGAVFWP
jgi:hypothetical protein